MIIQLAIYKPNQNNALNHISYHHFITFFKTTFNHKQSHLPHIACKKKKKHLHIKIFVLEHRRPFSCGQANVCTSEQCSFHQVLTSAYIGFVHWMAFFIEALQEQVL